MIGLILGGELLLPVLEEAVLLTLEWAEKTADILFEEGFGLSPESSQKVTAWTGLLLAIGLSVWGGYKLRKMYLQAKAVAPGWWKAKKAEMRTWWVALSWTQKLAHIAGGLVLVSLVVLLI